jgi:hypothetical protein
MVSDFIICGRFSILEKVPVRANGYNITGYSSKLKKIQRINHNSFVDYWIIKEVSPILITPE